MSIFGGGILLVGTKRCIAGSPGVLCASQALIDLGHLRRRQRAELHGLAVLFHLFDGLEARDGDGLPAACPDPGQGTLRQAAAAFGPAGTSVDLPSPATPEAVYWAVDRARGGVSWSG